MVFSHDPLQITDPRVPIYLILVTSCERHDVTNNQQLDCLLKNLLRLTAQKTSRLRITGPLCGKSTGRGWIPFTKSQLCVRCVHVMTSSDALAMNFLSYRISFISYYPYLWHGGHIDEASSILSKHITLSTAREPRTFYRQHRTVVMVIDTKFH